MKTISDFYNWNPMPPPPIGSRVKCPECGKERRVDLQTESDWVEKDGKRRLKKRPATANRRAF